MKFVSLLSGSQSILFLLCISKIALEIADGSPSPSVESIDDKLKAVEEQSTETVSSVENQPESQTKTEGWFN